VCLAISYRDNKPYEPRKLRESIMTKIILALTLALATLATVPASALDPYQDDVGYGRTSMGCGG
jgi:hypothetical protein